MSSDPPIIIFSVGTQDDGSAKDTVINIEKRPEFTVNIASVDQLPVLNETSATLPYGTSEVTANDVALEAVEGFSMPRVRDSKIAFQCERYHLQKVGNRDQMLVFGEIKSIYVADDCVEINEKGRIKIHSDGVEPLSRLGAGEYATFGEIMQAKRPA